MLVLGIDPGTARTGYGLVRSPSPGTLQMVDYGVITTGATTPMPERLQTLYEALTELLKQHQPDEGAVEQLFFQRNVSTAITVGQARGVALLALAQSSVPIAEYTPLEIKQAVVGYGGAEKAQVQSMVKILLGMGQIPKPDDAADALAVAICHIHSRPLEQRLESLG